MNAVGEMLVQIRDGKDIPAPANLLSNLTPEKAARILDGRPYSILTNLAHAVFWQDLWLDRLQGVRARSITQDWKVPDLSDLSTLRDRFLAGLDEAISIASAEPMPHKMRSDDTAWKTLIQLAVHDAYHLGQINLLKRELRLAR